MPGDLGEIQEFRRQRSIHEKLRELRLDVDKLKTLTGAAAATIADDAVTNAKLANMAEATLKGRAAAAGTGDPTDLVAAQVRTILNVADGANNYSHPNHSGDVTSSGDGATTIADNAVTNAKAADMAQATLKGRAASAGSGDPTDLTPTQARTILNVADGANNYSHPNHSGDVTSSGDGATTIADNAVTNAKAADMAQATLKGRASAAGTGDPTDLTPAQARTILNVADGANNYSHPNHSGDVTSSGDGATTIANDAVSNAKLANMAEATLKGRAASTGTGDPGDLSASQVRTILNVSSGADGTAAVLAALALKYPMTGTDSVVITDGNASNVPKRVYIADVAEFLAAYFATLAGRSGGQTLYGGTAAGDTLALHTTSNATKGVMNLAGVVYVDEVNGRAGFGTSSPESPIHLQGATTVVSKYRSSGAVGAGRSIFQLLRGASGAENGWDFGSNLSLANDELTIRELTSGSVATRLTMLKGGALGIGASSPAGQTHIDQSSSTAAIPVLVLDQADLSEEFIEFDASVGAGNPIDTAAIGTYYGKIRVSVNGTFKYIPLYNS